MKILCVRDHVFGIQLLDCSKLPINWKNDNDVKFCRHDITIKFFWRCLFSLVRCSYWFKFHVNIITGSKVMTIFVYKGLTRNSEIVNTLNRLLPNIRGLREVRNIKYDMIVSSKCHWMLQNTRTTAFAVSELLRENQQYLFPLRLRLMKCQISWESFHFTAPELMKSFWY